MTSDHALSLLDASELMASEQLLILDLRDPVNFRCGHMPKAINLGQHERTMLLANLSKELPLLIYAEEGETAEAVADLFTEFGFSNCFYLEAGYDAWQRFQQCSAALSPSLCQWLTDTGYQQCDVNQRGFNGETPLMTAAKQGLTANMIELIDHGADINAVNADGNSAVWLACYSDNMYALTVLIQEGADLNSQNANGATPLIYSASAGRFEMVHLLLAAGADYHLETLDGFSALDVAASRKVLKLLRDAEQGQKIVANPLGVFQQAC